MVAVSFDAHDPAIVGAFRTEVLGREVVEELGGVLVPGDHTQVRLRFVAATTETSERNRLHVHVTSSSLQDQQRIVQTVLTRGGSRPDSRPGFEPDGLRAGMALVHDPARVVTMVFSDEIAALGVQDWTGTRPIGGPTEMIGHYQRGDLAVRIRARHHPDDATQAHRELETGHGRGRIVILIEP